MADKEWLTGELKTEHLREIYQLLSAPLDVPEENIRRTTGTQTTKGYDTASYPYQYIINRFNEAVGLGHWRMVFTNELFETKSADGKKQLWGALCDCTMELGNMVEGNFVPIIPGKSNYGGSDKLTDRADALKAALSDAAKKTAAMFGVGREVFEGTLSKKAPHGQPPGEKKQGGQPATDRKKKVAEIDLIYGLLPHQNIDHDLFEQWAFAHYEITKLIALKLETLVGLREGIENNPENCKKTISEYLDKR